MGPNTASEIAAREELAAKQKALNSQVSGFVDAILADVKLLNEKIAALQGTAGVVTEEDQVLIDQAQSQLAALLMKTEALDKITPMPAPTPPSAPGFPHH